MHLKSIALLAGCALLASCATIVNTPVQHVTIDSNPSGAIVKVNGHILKGIRTPTSILVSRWTRPTITIELAGYKPYTYRVEGQLSGWFWGNILLGGLVGMTVDVISGSIYELDDSVYGQLVKDGPYRAPVDYGAVRRGDGALVVFVPNARHSWRKIGQMQKI